MKIVNKTTFGGHHNRERLQKEMISINISYLNYLNDTYVSLEASLTGPATLDFSP